MSELKFTISHTKSIFIFSLLKVACALHVRPMLVYIKSGNVAIVLWHCALSVFALCMDCSGNSALVRHFAFFFFSFFFSVSNSSYSGIFLSSVCIFFGNAATVLRHCALSVFTLCKHCSGNSALVRHFAFFFSFFFQFRTVATVEFFCHLFVFFFHIYCYTDIINFTIFSQLLRCQFFISQNKIIKYKIVTNRN